MAGRKVIWADYEATPPVVDRPLGEVTRREAEAAFDQLMEIKADRKDQLVQLLERNGVATDDSDSRLWVRRVAAWIVDSVEPKGASIEDIWFVVAQDVGLTLGDLMIRDTEGRLEWRLFTAGATDLAYQRPVVMGFERTSNAKYNYDPILWTANYAIAASQNQSKTPDQLADAYALVRSFA